MHPLVSLRPVSDSRTSSTASRMAAGSSCHSDETAVRPDLRVTSHRRSSPSPATAFHRQLHHRLGPPACGWRSGSRRRCRPSELSLPGRRPSPGPGPLRLLWAEECSVDTVDTGSKPGEQRRKKLSHFPS